MKSILELFEKITKIPRCSKNRKQIKNFLVNYARDYGFSVEIDRFDNIHCFMGEPRIALQAHYDMVCVGNSENIEIIQDDGFIIAKDSSLGADNGVAIAMMLYLMQSENNIEFLFTSDEEIGLIGALNIELTMKSKKMLNLDSESQDEIVIGCAGGFDIVGYFTPKYKKINKDLKFYEIVSKNFSGGHSGIDIHKGIKNAIKEAGYLLNSMDNFKLIKIDGGEKINSIPKRVHIVIASEDEIFFANEYFELNRISNHFDFYIDNKDELIDLLVAIPSGVLGIHGSYIYKSLNLSLIEEIWPHIKISLMGRANSNEDLENLTQESLAILELAKCEHIKITDRYPAWNREESEFAYFVKSVFQKVLGFGEFRIIHAGLECGVLKDRLQIEEIVSIGPNIYNPHSTKERVEIESIENIFKVLQEILKRL